MSNKFANKLGWNFDNSYSRLPEIFFAKVSPTKVAQPKIVLFNGELAASLGLDPAGLEGQLGADYFSGNQLPSGADPIAQAYAGHQFGGFAILGDGRAHLLGEQITPSGERFDIQLKGSGPTPFSRRGDGRAALGPMLREFIISEGMHALNIPTTRSLAVVTTGENVFRESSLPGGILTRVASSHIRVGTFEFVSAKAPDQLRALADYAIQRHYPEVADDSEPYLSFLRAVCAAQASLLSKWMLVGFVHGVMNTDNMAISGETIDYGPCAFMDHFSLSTVFSSIDRQGRYAYGRQAPIAEWNLTRFAETLLPLLDSNDEKAIEKAKEALNFFGQEFERHWMNGIRAKIGLVADGRGENSDDKPLIFELLKWMEDHESDYTNTFRGLSTGDLANDPFYQDSGFQEWHRRWQKRNPSFVLMRSHNPVVIPRNHLVEESISAAVIGGDYSVVEQLISVLKKPFDDLNQDSKYRQPAPEGGEGYKTFCGT